MGSKFGFLVRTKNEEKWVGYCLQSIKDHFPDSDIVIVDNDSTDDTLSIARMFQPKVITIAKNNYSPGKALNMGFSELDCDYICCISAHCEITSVGNDLEQLLGKQGCYGVIGRQSPIYKGKRITPINSWQNFSKEAVEEDMPENRRNPEPFFHNAYSFIPRFMWEKQPFVETISGKEDRRWAKTMKEMGYFSTYDPKTTCNHHWTQGCATWKGMG